MIMDLEGKFSNIEFHGTDLKNTQQRQEQPRRVEHGDVGIPNMSLITLGVLVGAVCASYVAVKTYNLVRKLFGYAIMGHLD